MEHTEPLSAAEQRHHTGLAMFTSAFRQLMARNGLSTQNVEDLANWAYPGQRSWLGSGQISMLRNGQYLRPGPKIFDSLGQLKLALAWFAGCDRGEAPAMAKLGLFIALDGGGGGGGGAGGFLSKILTKVMHTGGVVGSAGATRAVSPSVFAGAARYHRGGIAGLRPNEVPAILESGPNAEEVLTADDPRHVRNGGKSASINQKIVNVFDPVELLRVALADEAGQEVLVNHVSKNPRAYQAALSR
jgi:hypothetical protein